MTKMLKLIGGVAVLVLGTSAKATTTIDFNSFGGATSYSTSGVTFTADGQFMAGANSPNGTLALLANGFPHAETTAVFDALTSFVSVDLGDFDQDADLLFLEAFDSSNTLIGSVSLLTLASDSDMHTLSLSLSNIASVRFGGRPPSVAGSSVFADNFTFASAVGGAVPEPATWAMMILGFAGIGISIRRRRAGMPNAPLRLQSTLK